MPRKFFRDRVTHSISTERAAKEWYCFAVKLKSNPKSKLRILVVDDQVPVLFTYTQIFRQQGYDVAGARSYEEAVAFLRQRPFDLLLCDFGLGDGRNGLEIIDLAQSCQSAPACFLLTGYCGAELMDKATERGAAVLQKPISVPELLKALAAKIGFPGAA